MLCYTCPSLSKGIPSIVVGTIAATLIISEDTVKYRKDGADLVTVEQLSVNGQSNDVINPNETQTEDPETKVRQRPPIGELLKKLRGTKTLRNVESDTGITNAYLSNIELGLKNPGIKTLTKLSRYYQVPIDHLLHVAGIEGEIPQPADRDSPIDVQRAFDFVVTDPYIAHYQKPAATLPLDIQKYVVQIYEHYTGRKLL